MTATVEVLDQPLKTDMKRCSVPIIVRDTCTCGRPATYDAAIHYLSYPTLNAVNQISMWCDDQTTPAGCGREWKVDVLIGITATVISGAVPGDGQGDGA